MSRPRQGSKANKSIDLVAGSGRTRPRAKLGLESLEDRVVPTVTLSIADPVPFAEGNSGTTNMVFVVTRAGDTGELASSTQVDFGTVNGTAVAGVDYQSTTGTLTFAANETTKTISVPIIGNTTVQADRTFTVSLSNPLQQATFATQQTFTTGTSPFSVAFGDVNGDGRLDLAIANSGSNTVSVLLNTTTAGATTPTFAAKQDFATGGSPISVAFGDVNGDGRLDLAVSNFDSATVSVLLNITAAGATTPTFAAKQDFTTGTSPFSVAFGDVNGDGRLDLAVANIGSNTVSVLLNTTTPIAVPASFATQQTFGTGLNPYSVAVGDVNGDGRLDLAVANYNSDTVSVLLNTTAAGATTPSFAAKQDFATGYAPLSVAFGDVNGDGRLDLAVANKFSDTVSVLLNTTTAGATTPTFATQQDFATGSSPYSVAFGDVNGDGRLDLAVANNGMNNVSVLLNTTAAGAATPTFAAKQDFATGTGPISVAFGDVNGDGRLDLAVANQGSDTVSVLLNTTAAGAATPTFAAQQTFATGGGPSSVAFGDVNGDGRLDLAVANYSSDTVSVLLNTSAQVTLSDGSATGTIDDDDVATVSVGDVSLAEGNSAGTASFVVTLSNASDSAVTVNYATQDGTATAGSDYTATSGTLTFSPGETSKTVNVVVTGDTVVEANETFTLVLSSASGATIGTGTGTATLTNDDVPVELTAVSTGPGTAAQVNVLNPDGSLRFTIQPFGDYRGGTTTATGDVTNDGVVDIVVGAGAGATGGHVKVFDGVTGEEIRSFFAFDGFTGGVSVGSGDVNGDGVADILVGAGPGTAGGHVKVFDGVTGAEIRSFFAFDGFTGGVSVGSGDVNGDGFADIVVTATTSPPHVKVFSGSDLDLLESYFDTGFVI